MEIQSHLKDQWALVVKGLENPDFDFDLSEGAIQDLIDLFNIKIQKCSSGYICFKGHHVGHAKTAPSSGCAFCRFIKSQGLASNATLAEAVEKFKA